MIRERRRLVHSAAPHAAKGSALNCPDAARSEHVLTVGADVSNDGLMRTAEERCRVSWS